MILGNTRAVNRPTMTHHLPAWRRHLLDWLRHQTASPVKSLKRFTTGGFVFAGGMMMVLLAGRLIAPSLTQELLVLAGLLMTTLGGLYALSGYLAISLFRVLRFLLEPRE